MMKLYTSQINSYQQISENTVLDSYSIDPSANLYGIILDDSCLYPEGGGQPWDLGTINDQEVRSVEITSKGLQVTVNHSFQIGEKVICKVDWNRRYDFMQQHSCQHLLSATIHHHYGCETVKWELGRSNVCVDFLKESEFTSNEIENIEILMNSHIRSSKLITATIDTREQLETLPHLRGAPKGVAAELNELRIITIDGYDSNPCGGTHLITTAEIQMFKIIGQEKDRGSIRLKFICGNRIFKSLSSGLLMEMELSRLLCINSSEIVPTVSTLFGEKRDLVRQVKSLQDELAVYYAQELVTLWSKQSIPRHRQYILQHRPGVALPFLQLTAETIQQFNETQSLGIQAIFLSGSDDISSSASVASSASTSSTASSAAGGNKKKKSKNSGPSLPPSEFSLVIPSSPQSGSFIFYSLPPIVDQLKGTIALLLEGKAGGRPGRLQGQANALQNIVAVDELLTQTFPIQQGEEVKDA